MMPPTPLAKPRFHETAAPRLREEAPTDAATPPGSDYESFPMMLRPRVRALVEDKWKAAYREGYQAGYRAGQRDMLKKLSGSTSSDGRRISEIRRIVAAHYDITEAAILSRSRLQPLAMPRHVAMWLVRQLAPNSFPSIGRAFGGRDHSTVMHAVQKIEREAIANPEFALEIAGLRAAAAFLAA